MDTKWSQTDVRRCDLLSCATLRRPYKHAFPDRPRDARIRDSRREIGGGSGANSWGSQTVQAVPFCLGGCGRSTCIGRCLLFDFFEIFSEQIFWKFLQPRCWLSNCIGTWGAGRTHHWLQRRITYESMSLCASMWSISKFVKIRQPVLTNLIAIAFMKMATALQHK